MSDGCSLERTLSPTGAVDPSRVRRSSELCFRQHTLIACRFLGIIDRLGAAYEEDFTSTNYGLYFCLPLMRNLYHPEMTEEEARKMLEECARVGYYRNCFASSRIQIAKVTNDGCEIGDSYVLNTTWPA